MRILATVFALLLACPCCMCGYFSSGTWENDSGNWERAFQSAKPNDVRILHSYYWRSPHWSDEFQYFFEIERNDQLKQQLFTKNKLTQLEGSEALAAKTKFFGEAPEWFTPKPIDSYNVWIYEKTPRGNFRVFIDDETGNMFLTDYSI